MNLKFNIHRIFDDTFISHCSNRDKCIVKQYEISSIALQQNEKKV